jgi:hypothetical protein
MRTYIRFTAAVGGLLLAMTHATCALAANAYPVFTDINVGGQAFGVANASSFGGLYTLNDTATFNGNAVLSINQKGQLACCHGALIEINVSNGENGVNSTEGGANNDVPNNTPPNPVFAAIGNLSGKLENGNVIRFSAWFRSDPNNPITQDPQVQPIMKIEYWKEALSGNADTNGSQAAPGFGDRVFDQDQQGTALNIPDLPHWVDLNGDGVVNDPNATVGNGRVTQISSSEWRLAVVTHKVNSADWLGIGGEMFGKNDVTKIESVKAVMFMGDFANTNLTGDGPDGGNLLIDNALVEVFKDQASVTPINNPNPDTPVGVAGDYNNNGVVDTADYALWRDNVGAATLTNRGSGITGPVGAADYNFWKARFGSTSGSGAVQVPEPAGILLVLSGLLLAAPKRKPGRRRL